MTEDEVDAIFKAKSEERQEQWEQTRTISYYSAQFAKKVPTITDFMPFEWDKRKAAERLKNQPKPSKERMDEIIKKIQNGSEL